MVSMMLPNISRVIWLSTISVFPVIDSEFDIMEYSIAKLAELHES